MKQKITGSLGPLSAPREDRRGDLIPPSSTTSPLAMRMQPHETKNHKHTRPFSAPREARRGDLIPPSSTTSPRAMRTQPHESRNHRHTGAPLRAERGPERGPHPSLRHHLATCHENAATWNKKSQAHWVPSRCRDRPGEGTPSLPPPPPSHLP